MLEGSCNRCGLCCLAADGSAACENLILDNWPGVAEATRCGVWESRYHKMPIRMLRWDGTLAYESQCIVLAEHLAEGASLSLPKECSYTLVQIDQPSS